MLKMGKRNKSSSLESTSQHWNGDALVTVTRNERYPLSSEALMFPGFFIILLNMAFGLLPITVSGSRIKYFRCSVSQIYSFVFGTCILVLTIVFVPQQLTFKLKPYSETGSGSGTGIILTVLVIMGHVLGFFLLKIRGHWVAKRFPGFWAQLAKLLQKSVVDKYGVEYKQMFLIRCFSRKAVAVYILLMIVYQIIVYINEERFIINLFVRFNGVELEHHIMWYSFAYAGYLMWGMCNLSHILVTMLLCFIIKGVTVSLKGINDQLQEMVDNPQTKFGIAAVENEEMSIKKQKGIVEKLDNFTTCYALCQELTSGISKAWGISIVLEVIVALINLLGQCFIVLKGMYDPNEGGVVGYFQHNIYDVLQALTLGFTHFYFLFQLSCHATEMVDESKLPLTILNLATYQYWPNEIQQKIQMFKMDIANSSICLSASNYFQVNKYLITSLFGAITTYLIVLLQFTQTEAMKQ